MKLNRGQKLVLINFVWVIIFFVVALFFEIKKFAYTEILLKVDIKNSRSLSSEGSMGKRQVRYSLTDVGTVDIPPQLKTVYVSLQKDDSNIGHFLGVSFEKPKTGIFLKGDTYYYDKGYESDVFVKYGIEDAPIPDHLQDIISKNRENIYIKILIDKDGKAIVKNFVLNGKDLK